MLFFYGNPCKWMQHPSNEVLCSSNIKHIALPFIGFKLFFKKDTLWYACLEKRMATHSNILAWRIPWTFIWFCGCLFNVFLNHSFPCKSKWKSTLGTFSSGKKHNITYRRFNYLDSFAYIGKRNSFRKVRVYCLKPLLIWFILKGIKNNFFKFWHYKQSSLMRAEFMLR